MSGGTFSDKGPKGDKGDPGDAADVTFSAINAAIATANASINVNGQKLTNLGDPGDATDADTLGARNAAILSAGFYDFGGFSSIGSGTVQYMVCSGPNPNSGQTSPPRGYPVMDSISVERIAVVQNVGTGTAVHRFEVYASVNGAAYAATGKVLDLAITSHYGQVTFSPPLSLAAGDRIGLATWMVSGSQSGGATQVGARLTYRAQ